MASAPGLGQNVTETQQSAAPLGELVVVEDGDRVVCHVCGRAFAFLPGYLGRHRLTAGEYRERFGLGRSTPLCAPAVLVRRRELGLDRYAGNSRLRAGLATGQKMARSGQLLELSHAG
jgi:predicted transcriptional regulator